MLKWNACSVEIMFTLASVAVHSCSQSEHSVHMHIAHTCVMHNMHSPVTWLCHLFVAVQLHFILLIILWINASVERPFFPTYWSREILVGVESNCHFCFSLNRGIELVMEHIFHIISTFCVRPDSCARVFWTQCGAYGMYTDDTHKIGAHHVIACVARARQK